MPDQETASSEARLRQDFAQEGVLFPGLTDAEPRVRKAAARRARRTRLLAIRVGIVIVIGAVGVVILTRSAPVQPARPSLTAGLGSRGLGSPLFCLSSNWCIAEANGGFAPPVILWSWNGRSWTAMPDSRTLASDTNAQINDFSCTSPTQCVAVGSYETPVGQFQSRDLPLTLDWDGASWKQSAIAPGPDNTSAELDSVACPARDDCIAVGATTGGALTEHWDGKHWAVVANPLARIHPFAALATGGLGGTALSSVSCRSTVFCMAVGQFTYLGQPGLLARLVSEKVFGGLPPGKVDLSGLTAVELWDGTRWTAMLAPYAPNVGATQTAGFAQVACASSTDCVAVGYPPTADRYQNGVDAWNGRMWQAATMPGTGPQAPFAMPQLSCTAGLCVVAVPPPLQAASTVVTVELWTGSGWRATTGFRVPVPAPADNGGAQWTAGIDGLGCSSAHFCLAIGGAGVQHVCGTGESYIASWNGTGWMVATYGRYVPPPNCR